MLDPDRRLRSVRLELEDGTLLYLEGADAARWDSAQRELSVLTYLRGGRALPEFPWRTSPHKRFLPFRVRITGGPEAGREGEAYDVTEAKIQLDGDAAGTWWERSWWEPAAASAGSEGDAEPVQESGEAVELPLVPNGDVYVTCIFCRSERRCEFAISVLRPGERSLVGIHEACVAPLRRRNRSETPSRSVELTDLLQAMASSDPMRAIRALCEPTDGKGEAGA